MVRRLPHIKSLHISPNIPIAHSGCTPSNCLVILHTLSPNLPAPSTRHYYLSARKHTIFLFPILKISKPSKSLQSLCIKDTSRSFHHRTYVRSPSPVRLLKTFQILSLYCSGFSHILQNTLGTSSINLFRYDMMHNELSR